MNKSLKNPKFLTSKKSQAALEFLTTYGWAFLVILIMIAALAYFGILKPSRLLPDRCNVGPEFGCQDFQLSRQDNSLRLRLKNNLGEPIALSSVTLTTEAAATLSCTNPDITGIWSSGQIKDFTFSSCNHEAVGLVAGEKGKVLFSFKYYSVRSGSGYTRQVDGEVFGTVI